MQVAIGVRVHSGWAAVVAISGGIEDARVMHRSRMELIRAKIPAQPYHYVEHMKLERARSLLEGWRSEVEELATAGLGGMAKEVKATVCGLLMSSGRELPELGRILASHAAIHSAEGEFFREAIAAACKKCKLPLVKVREKELFDEAVGVFGRSEESIAASIAALRQQARSPWTADEKLAALVGLVALSQHAASSKQ